MPGLVWPNGGSLPHVTSEYGMRFHPIDKVWRLHGGIDLVGFSTVCSPVDGVVAFAGYSGGWGNLVKVRAYGPTAFRAGDEHWLAHNARFLVGQGARVVAGQGVAIMGTTGASTGIHCHYETRPGGGATVNPRDYFATASGGGSNPYNPEDNEMDATQAAQLAGAARDIGIVKQLLTETEQWKGIGAIVSETLQNVGVVRQLLTETEQWKGIGYLVSKTYETVTFLAAAVAELASREDADIDPAVIAALRDAVTDLAAIDFPSEATIVDAVEAAAQRARIDELEAELARLKA